MNLVLASASASRANLLRAAGIPFDIQPAHVDEEEVKRSLLHQGRTVGDVAHMLAELKALRVSMSRPGDLVLGADQVLEFDGELVSKCGNLEDARTLLSRLRGKRHALIGSLVLAKDSQPVWHHASAAQLTMRAFSDAFLDRYLASEGEAILACVGCYRLEGAGAQLFERIEGDYFGILGLSLLPLLAVLREHGIVAV
jgi:septum formation protein